MASGTRVRDWAKVDFYALLGVEPNANAETITRAFREQAKQAHPDTTGDPAAAVRFGDITAAYEVLGDPKIRRQYDEVRAEQDLLTPGTPRVVVASVARRRPWSRRRAWTVLLAGVLVTLLGFGAAYLTWSMHEHDANLRARYTPVTASRIDTGVQMITFLTSTGRRVTTREPQQHGDPSSLGPTVKIRYDPADPERVIVDDSNLGRDITFTIVALKLLVGGPFFTVFGWRRLKAAR
jgi:hypothetical protein